MWMTMRPKPLSACSRLSLVVWILTAQHSLQPESKHVESRLDRFSEVMPDQPEEPEAMCAKPVQDSSSCAMLV